MLRSQCIFPPARKKINIDDKKIFFVCFYAVGGSSLGKFKFYFDEIIFRSYMG